MLDLDCQASPRSFKFVADPQGGSLQWRRPPITNINFSRIHLLRVVPLQSKAKDV